MQIKILPCGSPDHRLHNNQLITLLITKIPILDAVGGVRGVLFFKVHYFTSGTGPGGGWGEGGGSPVSVAVSSGSAMLESRPARALSEFPVTSKKIQYYCFSDNN